MPQPEQKQRRFCARCTVILLITGPFSILVGFEGGMMALNDRLSFAVWWWLNGRPGIFCQ